MPLLVIEEETGPLPIDWPIVITDFASPRKDTIAGHELVGNMRNFARYGSPQSWPIQEVDIYNIPKLYLDAAEVLIAGSPAGHTPDGGRTVATHVRFKQNAFYSMQWQTPACVAVLMTFSLSACPELDWRTDNRDKTGRVLIVSPAMFRTYKPRKGLATELTRLSDTEDTMVAMYLPGPLIPLIKWTDVTGDVGIKAKVDVAASIANWRKHHPHAIRDTILTLSAYTGELETDLLAALVQEGHDSRLNGNIQ